MTHWIALLRGVNVGGRNTLPMKSLSEIFIAAGGTRVRTYIQSGNVVFEADIQSREEFVDAITDRVEKQHGFPRESAGRARDGTKLADRNETGRIGLRYRLTREITQRIRQSYQVARGPRQW